MSQSRTDSDMPEIGTGPPTQASLERDMEQITREEIIGLLQILADLPSTETKQGRGVRRRVERAIAALQAAEPVAYAVFSDNGNIQIWCADPIQAETLRQEYGEALQPLFALPCPPAKAHVSEYGDAYQGAREDLAIWKRRALEAEASVRHKDQIIDRLTSELQGDTRFGEPSLPAKAQAPEGWDAQS